MTNTVEVFTTERAEFLATFPMLVANGHAPAYEGSTVELSDEALAFLADLDPEADGHYGSNHIWIGGTGYRVERA